MAKIPFILMPRNGKSLPIFVDDLFYIGNHSIGTVNIKIVSFSNNMKALTVVISAGSHCTHRICTVNGLSKLIAKYEGSSSKCVFSSPVINNRLRKLLVTKYEHTINT